MPPCAPNPPAPTHRWQTPALVLLYLLASALATWRSLPWWQPVYANTAWFLNYADGFVKRGLPGEVLRQFGLLPTHELIQAISLGITASVWLAASLMGWQLYRRSGQHPGVAVLAIGFAASSATVQHLLIDEGRFDHLVLALTLLAMALIGRCRSPALAFAVALPTTLLSLLIHEASLLLFTPLLLGWWAYRHGRAAHSACLALGLLAVLAAALIASLGGRDAAQLTQDFAAQQARAGGWLIQESYAVPYKNGVAENTAMSLQRLRDPQQLWHHLELLVFALLPWLWLLTQLLRHAHLQQLAVPWPLLWALPAPLALYAISIDFFRWWAWSFFHLFVVLSLLALCERRWLDCIAQVVHRHWAAMAYVALTSLLLGGMGPDTSYPLTTVQTRWGAL